MNYYFLKLNIFNLIMSYRGRGKRNYTTRKYKKRNYGGWGKRGSIYGKAGWQLNKDVSMLKGLINVEFKVNEIVATSVVTTTPLIAVINSLATGDQFNTRDGRVVRWKSIQIALELTMHTTPINDAVRIMVVIDKQPNELILVISDLINAVTMVAMRNLDQRKRFIILRDDVVVLSVGKGTNEIWKYYKKIDMKAIYDDSDAGSIADMTTNALYLILFGTEATNGTTVSRVTRMRFIDN